jgi:hypothetical protein
LIDFVVLMGLRYWMTMVNSNLLGAGMAFSTTCYVEVEYRSNTAWSATAIQALSSRIFVLNGLESTSGSTFPPLSERDQS